MRPSCKKAGALAFLLHASFAAPAQASGIWFMSSELLAMFQLSGQYHCLTYTYDVNGNRLASGSQTYSTAPTWGTSIYGCFSWS